MLGLKGRPYTQAPYIEPPPPSFANAVYALGNEQAAKLGGEYHGGGIYSFMQLDPTITGLVQLHGGSGATLAVDYLDRLIAVGGNTEMGPTGVGTKGYEVDDWTWLRGGVHFYPEEVLTGGQIQPEGPLSPKLGTRAEWEAGLVDECVIAVAGAASKSMALCRSGHVLAWGASTGGALGVGFYYHQDKAQAEQKAGLFPTFAPGYIQVSGIAPVAGGPDPRSYGVTEAMKLKGIVAIANAQELTLCLDGEGWVWLTGRPSGWKGEPALYAIRDPAWTPDPANLPIAIWPLGKSMYGLILEDGTPRLVGNNAYYTAGNGSKESVKTTTREVITPLLADKTVPKKCVAGAGGEYSNKILKDNGVVYTSGSNVDGQQGVINPATGEPFGLTEPQPYLVPMTTLNEGGRKVIAISGAGEAVHGDEATVLAALRLTVIVAQKGAGANGCDSYLYLRDDGSVKVFGAEWTYNSGQPEKWEWWGNLGWNKPENSLVPITPVNMPPNIVAIHAGVSHHLFLAEPAAPGLPSIEVTAVGSSVTVTRRDPPAVAVWRAPEDYDFVLRGQNSGLIFRKNKVPLGTNSVTFTGIPTNELYEAAVVENIKTEKPAILTSTGISGHTASATWGDPTNAEPGWVAEYQRLETYRVENATPVHLTAALDPTKGPITSLPVTALAETIGLSALVAVYSGSHQQVFTCNGKQKKGQTFILVQSQTPNFAYPSGSEVVESNQEDRKRSVLLPGSARSITMTDIPSPGPHGLTGTDLQWWVEGSYRGAYGSRGRLFFLP